MTFLQQEKKGSINPTRAQYITSKQSHKKIKAFNQRWVNKYQLSTSKKIRSVYLLYTESQPQKIHKRTQKLKLSESQSQQIIQTITNRFDQSIRGGFHLWRESWKKEKERDQGSPLEIVAEEGERSRRRGTHKSRVLEHD